MINYNREIEQEGAPGNVNRFPTVHLACLTLLSLLGLEWIRRLGAILLELIVDARRAQR